MEAKTKAGLYGVRKAEYQVLTTFMAGFSLVAAGPWPHALVLSMPILTLEMVLKEDG